MAAAVVSDARDLGAFIPANLDDYGLSPHAFRLYAHYVRRAGRDGGIWTSNAKAAEVCRMSGTQLKRAKAELVENNLVAIEARPGRTSLVRLLKVTDAPRTYEVQGSDQMGLTSQTTQVHEGTALEGSTKKVSGGAAKRPRKRDLLFEAICEAVGLDLNNLTGTERGRVNKAAKELREVSATPEELIARASRYRKLYPDAALTPQALTGNWGKLVDPDRVPKLPKRLCGCGAEITGTHKPETCIFGGDDP